MSRNRWRAGGPDGRVLYVQLGDDPSKDDIFLGIVESRGLAGMVVTAVNEYLERQEALDG